MSSIIVREHQLLAAKSLPFFAALAVSLLTSLALLFDVTALVAYTIVISHLYC